MTEPDFPFEADFDADAERRERGPLDRRSLVVTLVVAAIGAVVVGIIGVIAALELAVSTELAPVVLTGIGPLVAWLVGATLALIRLVRRQRRAWLPMLLGVAAGIVLAAVGVVWWLRSAGLA